MGSSGAPVLYVTVEYKDCCLFMPYFKTNSLLNYRPVALL